MPDLAGLAVQIILDRVMGREVPIPHQSKIGLGFIILSVFLIFITVAFIFFSLFLWLGDRYQPYSAGLLTAAITLFLAVLSGIIAVMILQYKRMRAEKLRAEASELLHDLFNYMEEEFSEPIQENPKTAMFMASVAGYAVGERLR